MNTTAVVIFILSLFLSLLFYSNESKIIDKIAKTLNFSFILSILMGACYFLYSMSHEMTLDNIGNYLTVIMLVIIYPSISIVAFKIYQKTVYKSA